MLICSKLLSGYYFAKYLDIALYTFQVKILNVIKLNFKTKNNKTQFQNYNTMNI